MCCGTDAETGTDTDTDTDDDCIKKGHKYTGGHITTKSKVYSTYDCYKKCQDDSDCKYWSLDTWDDKCYLKTSKGSGDSGDRWVSGSRSCKGSSRGFFEWLFGL
jgi:hypothetical protein